MVETAEYLGNSGWCFLQCLNTFIIPVCCCLQYSYLNFFFFTSRTRYNIIHNTPVQYSVPAPHTTFLMVYNVIFLVFCVPVGNCRYQYQVASRAPPSANSYRLKNTTLANESFNWSSCFTVSLLYLHCVLMGFNPFPFCKISLNAYPGHTQRKLKAVLDPFGVQAWFWSLLKDNA